MKLTHETKHKLNVKEELKVADGYLDLRTLDTNTVLNYLDNEIKKRELPVHKKVKLA